MHMRMCMWTCARVHAYVYVYVRVFAYAYVCVCVCVRMYMCMCTYVSVHGSPHAVQVNGGMRRLSDFDVHLVGASTAIACRQQC